MKIDIEAMFSELGKLQKIKANEDAIKEIELKIKEVIKDILREAKKNALKDNRKEIIDKDLYKIKIR